MSDFESHELWFRIKQSDAASIEAWRVAGEVREGQLESVRQDCADYATIYDPLNVDVELPGSGMNLPLLGDIDVPGFNVGQAVTDALLATVTRNKVLPWFVTHKGDHKLQKRAENLTLAVQGTFMDLGVYDHLGMDICRDGCVHNDGFVEVEPNFEDNEVTFDRVPAWQLGTPPVHGKNPREFYRVYSVPRDTLLARFKSDEKAIRIIKAADPAGDNMHLREFYDEAGSDMVEVRKCWHLPSGHVDRSKPENWGKSGDPDKDAEGITAADHDGRYMMMVGDSDGVLIDEPYPYPYPPIARFTPKRRSGSAWRGRGVIETLIGVQLGLHRLDERIDSILHMHGRPIIYVDRERQVNTDQITNDVATVVEGRGPNGIDLLARNSVPNDLLNQRRELIQWGFQQFGFSELTATSKKPTNVESGIALQTLLDTESVRHSDVFHAWELFHVELGKLTIDCMRRLVEENGDVAIKAISRNSRHIRQLKFKGDCDLEDNKFHLQVWPSNLFGNSPSANLDRAMSLYKEGLLEGPQVFHAINAPDVAALLGDTNAALENIERKIDDAVENGTDITVHSYCNLQLFKTKLMDRINRLEADGMEDDESTDKLRTAYNDVEELLLRQAEQQAALQNPQAPAPPPQPGPVGVAPPTDLPQEIAA